MTALKFTSDFKQAGIELLLADYAIDITGVVSPNNGKCGTSIGRQSGKYYFEVNAFSNNYSMSGNLVGISDLQGNTNVSLGFEANELGYYGSGRFYDGNGADQTSGPASWATALTNQILMVAVDFDASKLWFGLNGVWQPGNIGNTSPDPETGTDPAFATVPSGIDLYPAVSGTWNSLGSHFGVVGSINDFTYTPPSGFLAWDDETAVRLSTFDPALTNTVSVEPVLSNHGVRLDSSQAVATISGSSEQVGSDKYYFEVFVKNFAVFADQRFGFYDTDGGFDPTGVLIVGSGESWAFRVRSSSALDVYHDGSTIITNQAIDTLADGAVLGFAIDRTTGDVWLNVDGVWQTGDPVTGSSPFFTDLTVASAAGLKICCNLRYSDDNFFAQFAEDFFTYTVPTGFLPFEATPSEEEEVLPTFTPLTGIEKKDIAIEQGSAFDLVIENGDFKNDGGFDSAIWVSLFTDARATVSEVLLPESRRGWIGNTVGATPDRQLGGLLWLAEQRRWNQDTLNKVVDYARKSLVWFIEDNIAVNLDVSGELVPRSGIALTITITARDGVTSSHYVPLWKVTGV